MRFRGGAVGHKSMRQWDDILQRDGHGADKNRDDMDMEDADPNGSEDDWIDDENDIEEVDDDDSSDGEEREYLDDEDRVVADNGEELDDDVLAEEGYGVL